MLKTIKVSQSTFIAIQSLQLELLKRTKKSISKGALLDVLVGRYIDESNESQRKNEENSQGRRID